MLLFYCLILIIICSSPILIIWRYSEKFSNNLFRNHIIIFFIKLIIISMFIYVFISNLSISNSRLFITIGCFIFVIFHFIEGLIVQKILLKDEIKN